MVIRCIINIFKLNFPPFSHLGNMKLRRSNQTSCRTSSIRSSKQKNQRTPRASSCGSNKSGASRSIRCQSSSCVSVSENPSSSIRSSRQMNRKTPRKSRDNSCARSCGCNKSGISEASRSIRSQSPSCSSFTEYPSSNAASGASFNGSFATCASDKTSASGIRKSNSGDSISCESFGKSLKRSREHDSPFSSAFSLPDQGEETGSNRTHCSCGSICTRSEKQNACDIAFRSNQSDGVCDSCSFSTPPSKRNVFGQPPKQEPKSIIRNNVEKKCGAKLKYQRCELSDENVSADPIENATFPKDILSPPKFKGTFVLQPEKVDQLTADVTQFSGTVTFTSTQFRDSWEPINEESNSIGTKTKKQRIEEEADMANQNNYGRILKAHYCAARVMRSCNQEECQEQPKEEEEECECEDQDENEDEDEYEGDDEDEDKDKEKDKDKDEDADEDEGDDEDENEDEDEDENEDENEDEVECNCNETPKCPPRKTSCRKSKSINRLAIKTAALVGYSYRMKDKTC